MNSHTLKKKLLFVDAQWIKNTAETENGKIIGANSSQLKTRHKNINIVRKFKENVRSILEYTNATPIRGHWGIGYACTYCKFQDPFPAELKEHTLSNHANDTTEVDNVKSISEMIIKIDITGLKCQICDTDMSSLDELMEHLSNHDVTIHFDINKHILPFKFETEQLECALCYQQFNYFKHLAVHMNDHFPNYSCVQCGRQFVNKRSLKTHVLRHKTGVFVCSYCSKIFDTRIKMREHERVLHLRGSKTRKCGYCEERFMDPVRKKEHEVREHGAPVPQYECKACGKCFESQRALRSHTNDFHLLLRLHACPECGKGFYSKNELKRHSVKHTGIKEFQCETCLKWYASRNSLKTHMKIHENEQYSCERCGEAFVQKSRWVIHMKKHAESDCAV